MNTAETIPFPKFANAERLKPLGYYRQQHDYVAPAGTTSDDVMKPTYWLKVATLLRTYDTLVVIEEGGQWFAELLVLSSDAASGVHVGLLRGVNLHGYVGANDTSARNFTGAVVKYRGPHLRWSVLDKDGKVLDEKKRTEAEAYTWLNQWVRTVQK